MCGLIQKTVGLAGPLQAALAPLADRITAAFVYGSIARGTDRAASDIDLMVIADDLNYSDLFAALTDAEAGLSRPINPNVMSAADWRCKRTQKDGFIARIAAQPKVFVIGSEHALGHMSGGDERLLADLITAAKRLSDAVIDKTLI